MITQTTVAQVVTLKDFVENAGQVLALLVSALLVIGAMVRYVALPWLEDRFAPLRNVQAQMQDVHHQVTVNGHVSEEPTLKDRVDSVRSEVRELKGETRRDLADMRADLGSVGRLYEAHMDWSSRESAAVWAAIIELRHGVMPADQNEGNPADDERTE